MFALIYVSMSKQFYFKQFSLAQVRSLVLFEPLIGPYQVLPLWGRVDLRAMAMKRYSAFPKAPALLEPHYQIVKCYIQDTRWGSYPLQRCSRCILLPQPTGLYLFSVYSCCCCCCCCYCWGGGGGGGGGMILLLLLLLL